jgi:DNA-binding response OmpR family regulator
LVYLPTGSVRTTATTKTVRSRQTAASMPRTVRAAYVSVGERRRWGPGREVCVAAYRGVDATQRPQLIEVAAGDANFNEIFLLKSIAQRLPEIGKESILILSSGLPDIEDKVRGLGFGADDYMTKPFHRNELVARIHAIVRRSKGHAQSVIQTGDLLVRFDIKTVEVNGARVHLTRKEYQMLELLSLRKGTTLTKETFLNHLYGGMDEPELKIIDVFICKLRKKLANASNGKNYIETVWGRGYVLCEPVETQEKIPA